MTPTLSLGFRLEMSNPDENFRNAALWAEEMLPCEGMIMKQHFSKNIYPMQSFHIRGCYAGKKNVHDKILKMKSQYSAWFWNVGSKSGSHQKSLGKSGVSSGGLITKNMKHIDLMLSKLWSFVLTTSCLCFEHRSKRRDLVLLTMFWWPRF